MSKKLVLVSALALGLAMSVGQVANAGTKEKKATCAQQATKAGIKNKKERADYIKKCKADQKKAKKMKKETKKEMKKEMKQEKKAN